MTANVETVHVIFKTHLDLGFTDLAQNVAAKYFDEYIPQAIITAQELRQSGEQERFVWTVGAWLIYEYLEKASPQARKRLEAAIEAGDITWHGLPFTMHSELMDASLFRYGLSLSKELDRRFGKQTIAAKMTDVPGHTRSIVPLLAQAGIRFLHIGVNPAITPPDTPPVFVWRDEESGAELMVMYQRSYGELMVVPGLADAITFAHTPDNIGPQTPQQVVDAFREIREAFPNANAIASTLDNYASVLLQVISQLPVITHEIADTWIHGVGTDPKKIGQFRALSRLRKRWLADRVIRSDDPAFVAFSRHLLAVPEHTWGLDEKTHLTDYEHYSRDKFDAAKQTPQFKKFAFSWEEQRSYIKLAIQALGDSLLADEARATLKALEPVVRETHGFEKVADIPRRFDTTHFELGFDPVSGAIAELRGKESGQTWAADDYRLGLFRYQTFSQADYDRFMAQYLDTSFEWTVPDFSKPGMAQTNAASTWWYPSLSTLWAKQDGAGHHFILELSMPDECVLHYGCPKSVTLEVDLPERDTSIQFTLQWFEKQASRLPEAIWFSFSPNVSDAHGWRMDKMGQKVSPLDVIRDGNRKLHAVQNGVSYHSGKHHLAIETPDAPLLAPGEPSLLSFNNEQPDMSKGLHFNLYNNIWGTNFPMWYEDNARFRFLLKGLA